MAVNTSFNKYISGARCTREEYLEAVAYYNESATASEREQFHLTKLNIGSKLFDQFISNKHTALKAFLRNRSLTEGDLPEYISCYTNSCKEPHKILAYLSITHNGTPNFYASLISKCAKESWTKAGLEKIARDYNISLDVLLNLLEEYFRINNKEEEYKMLLGSLNKNEPQKYKGKTNKYFTLYNMFLNNMSYQRILDYINRENIDLSHMKHKGLTAFIEDCSRTEGLEASLKIKEQLLAKINLFLDFKNKYVDIPTPKMKIKGYTSDIIFQVKRYITEVLYNPKRDAILKGIDYEQFLVYLHILKKYDLQLHTLLMNILKKNSPLSITNIKNLLEFISKGITDAGINRPFDIIDYYLDFGIPLDRLIDYFEELSPEERCILGEFINDNNDSVISPITIIDNKDNDESLTPEEIELIINYLIVKNIPVTNKTFTVAKNRLLSSISLNTNQDLLI